MVISTDKEALAKPLNFILKKAGGKGAPPTGEGPPNTIEEETGGGRVIITPPGEGDKIEAGENERGTWGSQFDFALSCIAYAVGLGNVWRFPYLCFKNGGGAFLIPYFLALLTCGLPLFFLEVSMGQYLGVGGMNVVGQLCPIFKGVGYSALMMVFLENVYYIIIVAWTLFYIMNTVYNLGSGLPWSDCDKGAGSWAHSNCFDPEGNVTFAQSDAFLTYNLTEKETMTPVESYWNNHVLQISSGIDVIGGVRWELLGYLGIAWLAAYFVVWKGLHNSTKTH